MSRHSITRLRSWMASSTFLNPGPTWASPGIGSVRDTEPTATTTWSYSSANEAPSSGWTVAVFVA